MEQNDERALHEAVSKLIADATEIQLRTIYIVAREIVKKAS